MLNIDLDKLQNRPYLLKTRNYEREFAEDVGGVFRNRKLYDIFEGRTRYEVKKQLNLQWLDAFTCSLYYKTKKKYVMLFVYYDKTGSVKEVYYVKPKDLLGRLGFSDNYNLPITSLKRNFPQAQVKIPVKKALVKEVAYRKVG